MFRLSCCRFALFILALTGCDLSSNRLDEVALVCGKDFSAVTRYVQVESIDAKTLGKEEFEAFLQDGISFLPVPVSSRGCIDTSGNGRVLVRSVDNESGVVHDFNALDTQRRVRLTRLDNYSVDFACRSNDVIRVTPDIDITRFVTINGATSGSDSIQLKVVDEGAGLSLSQFQLSADNSDENILDSLSRDRIHKLNFSISDLLRKSLVHSKTCSVVVDDTAPATKLIIRSNKPTVEFEWKGLNGIQLVREDDALFFETSEDTESIEYCAKKLDDDFVDSDDPKVIEWKADLSLNNCEDFQRVNRTQQFSLPSKGFWAVAYRSIDAAGNSSLLQTKKILLESGLKASLISSNAKNSIKSAILQQEYSGALEQIVGLEDERQSLPTAYEKSNIRSVILQSMLESLAQVGLNVPIALDSEVGDNVVFGRKSNKLFGFSPAGEFFIIDSVSGKVERRINAEGLAKASSIDISMDESLLLLRYSKKVEVWDISENGPYLKKSISFPDGSSYARFSNDGKSIIVSHQKVTSIDSETFEVLSEHEGPSYSFGIYPVVSAVSSSNVYYINSEKSLERLDANSGVKTVLGKFHPQADIYQIELSLDERFLLISDAEKGLWRFEIGDGVLTALDNPFNGRIDKIAISEDSDLFATYSDGQDILVRKVEGGTIVARIGDYRGPVYSLSFSSDSKKLAGTMVNGQIKLWSTEDFVTSMTTALKGFMLNEFFWSSDDNLNLQYFGEVGNRYHNIDTRTGDSKILSNSEAYTETQYSLSDHEPFSVMWCVSSLLFSSNTDSKCRSNFPVLFNKVIVSEDLTVLASINTGLSGDNNLVSIYSLPSLDLINSIQHEGVLGSLLSSDGKKIFLLDQSGVSAFETISSSRIWSRKLKNNSRAIWMSKDARYILLPTSNYSIAKLDLNTGEEIGRYQWSSSAYAGGIVDKLATSSDDKIMLTFMNSRELAIWNNETHEILFKPDPRPKSRLSESIAMNPSGTKIAHVYNDKGVARIRVWDIGFNRLFRTVCSLVPEGETKTKCQALIKTAN